MCKIEQEPLWVRVPLSCKEKVATIKESLVLGKQNSIVAQYLDKDTFLSQYEQ